MNRILWVDDEINLLKPHVLYLEKKGYTVTAATNGYDAVKLTGSETFDLVILDEMMVGMDGLETLKNIKALDSSIKAVMLTKSEEEGIFLEAVGNMIDDYLTKPVTPLQLYLSLRKNLEQEDIVNETLSKEYIKNYNVISNMIANDPGYEEWTDINEKINYWSLKLDEINDTNLISTFDDLKKNANIIFGNYISSQYQKWIDNSEERPLLSVDFIEEFIIPDIETEQQALIVIDCMPYDQMMKLQESFNNDLSVSRSSYYSILPTSTEFARNAIFSGLFPSEIEKKYPFIYKGNTEDEQSSNRYEHELLENQLLLKGFETGKKLKYRKVYRVDEFSKLETNLADMKDTSLLVIVVNMVDFLVHDKKKDELINEMLFTESSYRATIKNWFVNSSLFRIINNLGDLGFKITITTDHGAKMVNKFTKVTGEGRVSSGLRMKSGKNLSASNKKQTVFWQKPSEYLMPSAYNGKNIILAKEDHAFVFEKNLGEFYRKIKNTFQHGGVSLEEVILPVLTLKKKTTGV